MEQKLGITDVTYLAHVGKRHHSEIFRKRGCIWSRGEVVQKAEVS